LAERFSVIRGGKYFGAGVILFGGLGLLEIAILATMLSPTDAALGKAVVTNEAVPSNVRESLNVESGLNDGICVPILFLFLALVTKTGVEEGTSVLAVKLVAEEIIQGKLMRPSYVTSWDDTSPYVPLKKR